MIGTFLSPSSFRTPEWLVASGWLEHGPFGAWLVEAHHPSTLVELGTHHGFSYGVFCETVKRADLGTQCWAIDTWRGDKHAGFYDDSVFQRFAAHQKSHYASFSRLVRATFDEAVSVFADESIDLLHIDGRHYYADVRHDFETWKPKLSDRAIVLFHDTAVRDRDFGVFKLWDEVKQESPHFEFAHGNGLGVLGCGPEQTTPIQALFETTGTTHAGVVQTVYAHLGRALTNQRELILASVRLKKEMADRDAEIVRLRNVAASAAVKSMRR